MAIASQCNCTIGKERRPTLRFTDGENDTCGTNFPRFANRTNYKQIRSNQNRNQNTIGFLRYSHFSTATMRTEAQVSQFRTFSFNIIHESIPCDHPIDRERIIVRGRRCPCHLSRQLFFWHYHACLAQMHFEYRSARTQQNEFRRSRFKRL